MISTIESKQQQLANGYYQRGNGAEQILIVGSCRTLPYLSYLVRWNEMHGEPYTIRRIDPCDWTVENVDINQFETDERILSVLKSTRIFIHEHLQSYGMFNTSKDAEKNIYQFGMDWPMPLDISIPNWHDRFILFNDYTDCGIVAPDDYIVKGEQAVAAFCGIACKLSSFPEMADYLRENWRTKRFFYRPNHISSEFSMYVFRRMNSRFLHLNLTDEFLDAIRQEDLFKSPCTEVTQHDRKGYGITW